MLRDSEGLGPSLSFCLLRDQVDAGAISRTASVTCPNSVENIQDNQMPHKDDLHCNA